MIVLGKAVEPKVAKANSTYPAVVVNIGSTNGALVKLWFFCPSTMVGQPSDAVNPGGNNVVEAPVKPHQGENIDYNFQIGDVIIISYADGNLNTSQFVRYVAISNSVREQNARYIGGDKVIAGGYLQISNTNLALETDILAKAVYLLPVVRLCAKGSDKNNDIYMIYDGVGNPFVNDVVLYKCGIYGIEFATLDVPVTFGGDYLPLTLEYNGGIYGPRYTFLNFCQYIVNGGVYTDSLEILEVFKEAYNNYVEDGYKIDDSAVPKDEHYALFVYQALAGFDNWDEGGRIINPAIYQENTERPVVSLMPKINDWDSYVGNLYNNTFTEFRQYFWDSFSTHYAKELDRLYAIILHNNMYSLKNQLNSTNNGATNLSLVIFAVIATALQLLEYSIIEDRDDIFDKYNKEYSIELVNIKSIMQNSNMTISELRNRKTEIADFFSHMYLVLLNRDGTTNSQIVDVGNKIKNNIEVAIDYILDNADDILNMLDKTITGTPSTGSESSTKFIWPVPGHRTISQYWSNTPGSIHNGLDIDGYGCDGAEVIAVADGIVTISELQSGYGNYIRIKHTDSLSTFYAHCKIRFVNVGDIVKKGQKIALVGNTGNWSQGSHLHLGFLENNINVNPLLYLDGEDKTT